MYVHIYYFALILFFCELLCLFKKILFIWFKQQRMRFDIKYQNNKETLL